MIKKVTKTYGSSYFSRTYEFLVSDFKDGEQPRYTGHKRNYRKAKWSKHDYWVERYEHRPRCWKDQRGKGRNKRTAQYRPVCA